LSQIWADFSQKFKKFRKCGVEIKNLFSSEGFLKIWLIHKQIYNLPIFNIFLSIYDQGRFAKLSQPWCSESVPGFQLLFLLSLTTGSWSPWPPTISNGRKLFVLLVVFFNTSLEGNPIRWTDSDWIYFPRAGSSGIKS